MLRFVQTSCGDLVILSEDAAALAKMRRRFPVVGVLRETDGERPWLPVSYCAEGFDAEEDYLQLAADRFYGRPRTIRETERLRIREIGEGDWEEVKQAERKIGTEGFEEETGFSGMEKSGLRAYIRNVYELQGAGIFLLEEKNGQCVGLAGLEPEAEGFFLSYGIMKEKRRQGFAEEACRALIDYAWKELSQESLYCRIRGENQASRRLAEKLGFQAAGRSYIKRRN